MLRKCRKSKQPRILNEIKKKERWSPTHRHPQLQPPEQEVLLRRHLAASAEDPNQQISKHCRRIEPEPQTLESPAAPRRDSQKQVMESWAVHNYAKFSSHSSPEKKTESNEPKPPAKPSQTKHKEKSPKLRRPPPTENNTEPLSVRRIKIIENETKTNGCRWNQGIKKKSGDIDIGSGGEKRWRRCRHSVTDGNSKMGRSERLKKMDGHLLTISNRIKKKKKSGGIMWRVMNWGSWLFFINGESCLQKVVAQLCLWDLPTCVVATWVWLTLLIIGPEWLFDAPMDLFLSPSSPPLLSFLESAKIRMRLEYEKKYIHINYNMKINLALESHQIPKKITRN